MAKWKKTGGRDFKPGNQYGKRSTNRLPEDIKQMRKVNREELERVLNKYLTSSVDELRKLTKDNSLTGIEALVVRILFQAVGKGDHTRAQFLLQYLVPKRNLLEVSGMSIADLARKFADHPENDD